MHNEGASSLQGQVDYLGCPVLQAQLFALDFLLAHANEFSKGDSFRIQM
jgi:hypothetical protein